MTILTTVFQFKFEALKRFGIPWLAFSMFACAHAMSGDGPAIYAPSSTASNAPDSVEKRNRAAQTPDVYSIPVSKTEKLVYEFLSRENFEVLRTKQKGGAVVLQGKKGEERWSVFLKPESSSATAMVPFYSRNEAAVPDEIERLRKHIMTSLDKVSVESEDTARYVPPVVLSNIESVVCLESILSEKKTQFSGFIVDEAGLILATAHDLKGHQQLVVTLYDGRTAPGTVVRADHHWDLALIRVDLETDSHISLQQGRNLLGIGERLYTVGCPVNLRGTVFPGIVNGPPRRVDDRIYWQVSMKIHPGSSGSPVFDASGNLVAVVKGRFRGTDSLGFLIPFETIVEFAKEMEFK